MALVIVKPETAATRAYPFFASASSMLLSTSSPRVRKGAITILAKRQGRIWSYPAHGVQVEGDEPDDQPKAGSCLVVCLCLSTQTKCGTDRREIDAVQDLDLLGWIGASG